MAPDMGRTLFIAMIMAFAGSGAAAVASDAKVPCTQPFQNPNCLEREQPQLDAQRQVTPRKDEKRPRRRCRYILM